MLPTPPAVAETVPRLNSGGDGGGSGGGHHQHHQRKSANPKRAVNKSNACISEEDGIFAGEIDDREEEEIAAVQQQTQAAAAAAAAAAADMMKHFMQLQPPLMFSPTGGPDMKHPKEEKVDQDLEERAMHIGKRKVCYWIYKRLLYLSRISCRWENVAPYNRRANQ